MRPQIGQLELEFEELMVNQGEWAAASTHIGPCPGAYRARSLNTVRTHHPARIAQVNESTWTRPSASTEVRASDLQGYPVVRPGLYLHVLQPHEAGACAKSADHTRHGQPRPVGARHRRTYTDPTPVHRQPPIDARGRSGSRGGRQVIPDRNSTNSPCAQDVLQWSSTRSMEAKQIMSQVVAQLT